MLTASEIDFTFQINSLPPDLFQVIQFNGVEAISEPFRYNLRLLATSNQVDFDGVVGKNATLMIRGETGERFVHGRIARFVQFGSDSYRTQYRARFVPDLWRLGRRYDCRIFQEMEISEVIKQVFEAAKITSNNYTFKLQNTHPAYEYRVQYRECDLDFISRLMEFEGAHYFFDHQQNQSVITIADDNSVHTEIESSVIPFSPPSGRVPVQEHLVDFQFSQQLLEGSVSLWDYNYEVPAEPRGFAVLGNTLGCDIYDYPGGFSDDAMAAEIAAIQLEGIQSDWQIGVGKSTCRRFVPGFKFSLANHPRSDLNQEYLITRTVVSGGVANTERPSYYYHNRFDCVPVSTRFRKARRTPIPKIHTQTATVVGPSGEDIYTDELGRIKVQFHWDRDGQQDENSSCWVRVKQMWSGPGWGTLFIPRIGMEVVVEFLEGNPDAPLVTGCVYNGANPLPYALPGEKTKSTIKTNSSQGGGGSNELRFEDRKGSEEVYLHAQKDWTIAVENDKNQTVGSNESLNVGSNRTKSVGNDENVTIGNNRTENVGSNESVTVGQNREKQVVGSETVSVGGNETVIIAGNETVTVTGSDNLSVGGARQKQVTGTETETIGVAKTTNVGANMNLQVGGIKTETVTAASTETVGAAKALSIGGAYQVSVGAAMNTTVALGQFEEIGLIKKVIVGNKLELQCGAGKITIDKSGKISIEGTQLELSASGPVKINGSIVDIN